MVQSDQPLTWDDDINVDAEVLNTELRDQLRNSVPHIFTQRGQMVWAAGSRDPAVINSPSEDSVLLWDHSASVPVWRSRAQFATDDLPDGSITAAKLAPNAARGNLADGSVTEPKLSISNSPSQNDVLGYVSGSMRWGDVPDTVSPTQLRSLHLAISSSVTSDGMNAGDVVLSLGQPTGSRVVTAEFDLQPANSSPRGIAASNDIIYVPDAADSQVWAYNHRGIRRSDREFYWSGNSLGTPRISGIAYGNGNLWLLDNGSSTKRIHVFNASTKAYVRSFTIPGSTSTWGCRSITWRSNILTVLHTLGSSMYISRFNETGSSVGTNPRRIAQGIGVNENDWDGIVETADGFYLSRDDQTNAYAFSHTLVRDQELEFDLGTNADPDFDITPDGRFVIVDQGGAQDVTIQSDVLVPGNGNQPTLYVYDPPVMRPVDSVSGVRVVL